MLGFLIERYPDLLAPPSVRANPSPDTSSSVRATRPVGGQHERNATHPHGGRVSPVSFAFAPLASLTGAGKFLPAHDVLSRNHDCGVPRRLLARTAGDGSQRARYGLFPGPGVFLLPFHQREGLIAGKPGQAFQGLPRTPPTPTAQHPTPPAACKAKKGRLADQQMSENLACRPLGIHPPNRRH